jgi:hypothetical protein
MSASPVLIEEAGFHAVAPARPEPRGRLFRLSSLTVASLLSLTGFALVAAALRAPYGLATALLGFAGYVFLMSKALECLPIDWDVWTNRRKSAQPPSSRGKLVPFGRGPAPL